MANAEKYIKSQSLCLSNKELVEITERTKCSDQKKWLNQNKIIFVVRADGSPVVSRMHFLKQIGIDIKKIITQRRKGPEPDFEALSRDS